MKKYGWIMGGLLLSGACFAEPAVVAYVKNVSGEASITTGGKTASARVGDAVYQGSHLKTAQKSSLGITFRDDTVMSFGSDTDLTVDEYLYNPSQGKLKLGSKLSKGTLNYVSGVIAKLKPEAVTIKTPTGTIGVRGTQFVVKVEE